VASLYVCQLARGGGDDTGAHGDGLGAVEVGCMVGNGAVAEGVAAADADGEGVTVDAEGELVAT
jgi:hypothetical protein